MDSKRKANGATASDFDNRYSKRRKVSEFDLTQGESPESTTTHGLDFLEQLRRTTDKNDRQVTTYFETLPARDGNEEYYKQTRMPISLQDVESKLKSHDFKNLTELESYLKRMVNNAKEFFRRDSTTFEDAERVRKAISNYMVKTNPAYQDRNYKATPTPLPAAEGDESQSSVKDEASPAKSDDEDEDGQDEDDEADEGDGEPTSKRRSIILKRRVPARSSRNSTSLSDRPTVPAAKPDHQYEDVPYKGLDFQQAQEKIVEEIIRHHEPDYEDAYFEPFMNLPSRALKDYFKVIKDPLSVKKLRKHVKGIQGRQEATGVSEYKSWNAFEDKAKLLWENAYFYNEEGSEIYVLAQKLEKFFYKHLKQATQVVPEPAQPKIKLKVGQGPEPPSSNTKKITIHVGGRGGSVESPAPQNADSPVANGTPAPLIVEKTRSASVAVPSPSPATAVPAVKTAETPKPSLPDEESARPPSSTSSEQKAPEAPLAATPAAAAAQPTQPSSQMNGVYEPRPLRPSGKGPADALISRLRIQAHPHTQSEPATLAEIYPSPQETHTSATINVPPTQLRVCITPMLPEFLNERHYSLWALMDKQPLKPSPHPFPKQLPQERVFEVLLHAGINVIELHLVAAVPKHQRVEGRSEVEVEIFTAFVNVTRT